LEYIDNDSLQKAISCGILDIESINSAVLEMTRKELLAMHKYAIWEKKGVFITHIIDDEGKRAIRRRNTLEELEDMLVEIYRTRVDVIKIDRVFNEWIDEKLTYGEIRKQSYDRYKSDYKRFFTAKEKIVNKEFKNITYDDLEKFIKQSIRDHKLSRKSYSGLVTLLMGIFRFGLHKGYTKISITTFFGDFRMSSSIFTKKVKFDEQEIFFEDETERIITYLKSNPDIWNMALLLQFETGLRIGEIAALTKDDVFNKFIRVCRTEVKVKDEDGHWTVDVSEVPKTDAGARDVILPPSARETITRIFELNPNGKFLFENNGKRIRSNTFNKRLAIICDELNIEQRSTHKIRKTYASILLDSDVDDIVVAKQMGHRDISTTRNIYYYGVKRRDARERQIAGAIHF